jgi:hypothetical protein
MKVDEALVIFYKLKDKTKEKTETGIYTKFITILLDLRERDFNSNQKKDLETALLYLNLEDDLYPTKKELNKKLTSLEYFLATKFSIISKQHYLDKGMALWLFSSIILFYCFGQFSVIGALLFTIIFGKILDLEAKAQGRVIKIVNNQQEPIFIKEPFFIKEPIPSTDSSEKEEKQQRNKREELQQYRIKKLQQHGKEQVELRESVIKERK